MTQPKQPPQQGHAWRGDWQGRLTSLLRDRGYSSAREFAATAPTKSFVDLANDLGPGDVAAIQLQWRALDEAKEANEVELAARDLLVRNFHAMLPTGWSSDAKERRRLAGAIAAWASSVGSHLTEYKPRLAEMARAMVSEGAFPIGWLPIDADDPILVEFFKHHWVEP
jgi:hypothetical protein